MSGVGDRDRYVEYWAYLRQAEKLRFEATALLTTAGGVILGVLAGGGLRGGAWGLRVGALSLLGALLLGLQGFVTAHKVSYNHYFDLAKRLDGVLLEAKWPTPFFWVGALVTTFQIAVVVGLWAQLGGHHQGLRVGLVAGNGLLWLTLWGWYWVNTAGQSGEFRGQRPPTAEAEGPGG